MRGWQKRNQLDWFLYLERHLFLIRLELRAFEVSFGRKQLNFWFNLNQLCPSLRLACIWFKDVKAKAYSSIGTSFRSKRRSLHPQLSMLKKCHPTYLLIKKKKRYQDSDCAYYLPWHYYLLDINLTCLGWRCSCVTDLAYLLT